MMLDVNSRTRLVKCLVCDAVGLYMAQECLETSS